MSDLYEAIGSITAAAHAAGDKIDENIRPEDNGYAPHGLDVFHKSKYIRFAADENEPRFTVSSPYTFMGALRNAYTDAELAARVDVDLSTLSAEQRRQAFNAALEPDLRKATNQYDEFTNAFQEELITATPKLVRIDHGEEQLWNGFVVRDHLYPYDEEFSVTDYRRVVSRVYELQVQARHLAHDVVDVLEQPSSDNPGGQKPDERPNQQPMAPGFQ